MDTSKRVGSEQLYVQCAHLVLVGPVQEVTFRVHC